MNGQPFLALSFEVHCETQEEVDKDWDALAAAYATARKLCVDGTK